MTAKKVAKPPVPIYALSPAEFGKAIGVSRATVYNLIARGEVRYSKIGRSTRIPVTEIERVLVAGQVPA